jgi:hypothetical protein
MKLSAPIAVVVRQGENFMPDDTSTLPMIAAHGADRLQAVQIDGYNVELKDDEGSSAIVPVRARSVTSSRIGARSSARTAKIRLAISPVKS